jgi:hypothetical protein
MRPALHTKKDYERVSQLFNWATQEHYRIWFTSSTARHKRTEVILPRMVRRGELISTWYDGHLAYAVPRLCKSPNAFQLIEHGLGVTTCLVNLGVADPNAEIIPDRSFHGFRSVPDVGLAYPNRGTMILVEHTTPDNFARHKVETKLALYERSLDQIKQKFECQPVVLFVIDADRERISDLVSKKGREFAFFVDYASFKAVPIGGHLIAPIYLWGIGGVSQSLPLRHA